MVKNILKGIVLGLFVAGCSIPPEGIPEIPEDHPAQQFYRTASHSLVSDQSCRDLKGSPDIPMGEIEKGGKYVKLGELIPGVFIFEEPAAGKGYLAVSYMKGSGFLQMPKACSWEIPDKK